MNESPRNSPIQELKFTRAELLDKGNRTELWKLQATGSSEAWVLKCLQPFCDLAEERRRLAREAQFQHAARGGAPGIPEVLEPQGRSLRLPPPLGRLLSPDHNHESQVRFIIKRYVPGEDLAKRLERGTVDPNRLYAAALPLLRKVHQAQNAQGQRLGLVHRDLHPKNFLTTQSGELWLTDFGLALPSELESCPEEEALQGRNNWLAPELFDREPPSSASDLFQLGLLFACVLAPGLMKTLDHRPSFPRPALELHLRAAAILPAPLRALLSPRPSERPSLAELPPALQLCTGLSSP